MKKHVSYLHIITASILMLFSACAQNSSDQNWTLNKKEYLEKPGMTVLVFHDFYPTGKQGGVELIQHGERIASNGFIRIKTVDGKRIMDPERAKREIIKEKNEIIARVSHDDIDFKYSIRVWPEGDDIKLAVDLEKPIPAGWENKMNFEIGFYPPLYYGKTYQLDDQFGIVVRQGNGPNSRDGEGKVVSPDLAHGKVLTLAEEDPLRKVVIENQKGELVLYDERNQNKQGWLLVKSAIPAGVTENAVEWTIKPNVIKGWKREPVIAVSQVGYHPGQKKQALIELDPHDGTPGKAHLFRLTGKNKTQELYAAVPEKWGKWLAYNYAIFDFTSVQDPGMYLIKYGDQSSYPFAIDEKVYSQGIWQPTLEAFFPIQMCHMKVRDKQAIWHGACHLDDALQAPLDIIHIDGYQQYKNAESPYSALVPVSYQNQGGWHDAGDDDLAAGSQAATTHYLVLANEICIAKPDQTYINFESRYVDMYKPDGIPDFAQQIKAGALNLLGGYRAAGHSFTGIIANREGRNITGDWASQTDQLFYDSKMSQDKKTLTHSGVPDDRWVFTNKDTGLEYQVAAALAASSRSLKGYDDKLAQECLATAIKAWDYEQSHDRVIQPNAYIPRNTDVQEIIATTELLFTTGETKYASRLTELLPQIKKNIGSTAWCVSRITDQIKDNDFKGSFMEALQGYKTKLDSTLSTNPFGIPWRPAIWGIGWDIQEFALEHYYLVKKYPDLFDRELVLRVVNYVLGCHPGSSTSLVSGVGAHSVTNAFGVYRHMEYYIPGGMVSGTALIRPDFPELKENTPFLWQQSEYVMPGAASYIFCVLAAEQLLNVI